MKLSTYVLSTTALMALAGFGHSADINVSSSIKIDTSGRSGLNGMSGGDGSSAYWGGGWFGRGGDGQNGTPGMPGTDARDIQVILSLDPQNNNLVMDGARSLTSPMARINLIANGGDGGSGGYGGDGGRGANGSSGSDATCSSSGSNGENGGPGGNAGCGGDGAYGGDAGNISVIIPNPEHSYLSLLVYHSNHGGSGGMGGRNGSPGSGGWGGSGGSSASCEDSNGDSYTVSGGSSGWSGPSGSGCYHSPSNGNGGHNGFFRYILNGREYTQGFDIGINDVQVADVGFPDGIIEPEEAVKLKSFSVVKLGEMPMPERTPLILKQLNSSSFHFKLPNAISFSGAQLNAQRVRNIDFGSRPLVGVAGPEESSTGLQGIFNYPGLEFFVGGSANKVIQYPMAMEFTEQDDLKFISSADQKSVFVNLMNRSQVNYGGPAKGQRQVIVEIRELGGTIKLSDLTIEGMTAKQGKVASDLVNGNSMKFHVENMAPGNSELNLTIKLLSSARLMGTGKFAIRLLMQKIGSNDLVVINSGEFDLLYTLPKDGVIKKTSITIPTVECSFPGHWTRKTSRVTSMHAEKEKHREYVKVWFTTHSEVIKGFTFPWNYSSPFKLSPKELEDPRISAILIKALGNQQVNVQEMIQVMNYLAARPAAKGRWQIGDCHAL